MNAKNAPWFGPLSTEMYATALLWIAQHVLPRGVDPKRASAVQLIGHLSQNTTTQVVKDARKVNEKPRRSVAEVRRAAKTPHQCTEYCVHVYGTLCPLASKKRSRRAK